MAMSEYRVAELGCGGDTAQACLPACQPDSRRVRSPKARGDCSSVVCHRVVPAVQVAEQCNHGDDVDDLLIAEMLAQLVEVGVFDGVRNQRSVVRDTERGALAGVEERTGLVLEGRL